MKNRDLDIEIPDFLELSGRNRWNAGCHNTT